jgi:hypothetical protein
MTRPTTILIFFLLLLSACSKERLDQTPTPPGNGGSTQTPVIEKATIRFVTNADLTGQPYHSSNLRAVATIINDKGEQIVKDKFLSLSLPNPVKTESIELPVGDYKLTAFRMEYGSINTHFVTPMAGSSKASLVQQPLELNFRVEKNGNGEIPIEVLRVQQGEKPQQYGYPSGAFDYGQQDANPYMKIKIKAIMKIGTIVYDSLPAALTISTWNDKGEMTTTYTHLNAGVNEVRVLKSAVKFQFTVSKWGTNESMTFNKADINLNTVYILGGNKEAKKLKSERVYKQINGADVSESKTDYFYDATGKLSKIEYWLRKKDNTPYLAMTDLLEYSGGRATKIIRTNEENHSTMAIASYTYDNVGKVTRITQNDNGFETNASVEYIYFPTPGMKIHYTYPSRSFDMNYYVNFTGGNMTGSSAVTSNNDTESGRYGYDFNINPYAHMKWPNLFLSNTSINNRTSQQKEYYGSYPTTDPYSFIYTYDTDGYPTQVIKNFKSPATGNYLFSTKTEFVY